MDNLLMASYILQNWDILSLIVTNILALFVKSPLQRKKKS
jgi:hypothetical protein